MSVAWLSEWNLLHQRIEGLARAAEAMQAALGVQSTDHFSVVRRVIGPAVEEVLGALREFQNRYAGSLPDGAVRALRRSESLSVNLTSDSAALGNLQVVTAIRATAAEMDFHLGDPQLVGQRLTERAFLHLNRSLVVDDQLRDRWLTAFEKNEPACEKLGAVHLLAHGVYAFKANAEGGATDLVLSSPPRDTDLAAAEFLVLTEWKRIVDDGDAATKALEARAQTHAYRNHMLAGVELRTVRYIVLVSERQLASCPADLLEDGVRFKHINVAIDPDSPSKLARRAARRKKPGS